MVKPQQLQRFDDGKNRPEKPDGRRAALRSQVLELHGISRGSAGARSIRKATRWGVGLLAGS